MAYSIHWITQISSAYLSSAFALCVLLCKDTCLRMTVCSFDEKLPSALSGSSQLEEFICKLKFFVLIHAKRFVSMAHRFSTASKGIFFFPLHPIQRSEKNRHQGRKLVICSIQSKSYPLCYTFLFSRVYQLNCNNVYGSSDRLL